MRWADIASKDIKKLIRTGGELHKTKVGGQLCFRKRGLEHGSRKIEKLQKLMQVHADLQHQGKCAFVPFRTQTRTRLITINDSNTKAQFWKC